MQVDFCPCTYRMFFWVTFPSAATVSNSWPLLLLGTALLGVCSMLVTLSDNGVHTLPNGTYMMEYMQCQYAGCVCSLLSKALPPRGFLLRQDITWRRLFPDLAWVCWEPCWGWEGIKHLQGDCTDACWGEAMVSWAAPSCALIRDFICEHQLQWAFSKCDFLLEDVRV